MGEEQGEKGQWGNGRTLFIMFSVSPFSRFAVSPFFYSLFPIDPLPFLYCLSCKFRRASFANDRNSDLPGIRHFTLDALGNFARQH